MRNRPMMIGAATLVAGLAMAGCSSQSTTEQNSVAVASPAAPATTAVASSGPACDAATLSEASAAQASQGEVLVSLDGYQCSAGWAFTFPTLGPADGSEDGMYTMTMVFKADGESWQPQDRDAVCGTAQISDGAAPYPSDAQVPEDIWQSACQTN